jgi:hypothetical protein
MPRVVRTVHRPRRQADSYARLGVFSVMTRPDPVRCGKSRPVVPRRRVGCVRAAWIGLLQFLDDWTDGQARRGENDHALRVTVWGRVLRRNLKVNKRVLGGKGAKPCTTARFVRTQLAFWRNGGARTAGFIAASSVLRLAKTSSRLLHHLRPRWIRVSTKIFSAANAHHGKRPRDPDRRKTVQSYFIVLS